MVLVAVSQTFSVGIAIRYVLPVLRMTPSFQTMDPMAASRYRSNVVHEPPAGALVIIACVVS